MKTKKMLVLTITFDKKGPQQKTYENIPLTAAMASASAEARVASACFA
jgi:hypothetical protein